MLPLQIAGHFDAVENDEATHTWTLALHNAAAISVELLAQVLAFKIVEHRCQSCPHHFHAWRNKVENSTPLTYASTMALNAMIGAVFGVPSNPISCDHLEGYVGEMLWYFLHNETSSEVIVRCEPPSFKVTDQGGDSLVVYRAQGDYLMFRLWEMKKLTGTGDVSSTVATAYTQLETNVMEYLARYTAFGQELADPDLAAFYSRLMDSWTCAGKEASVGVSVATSQSNVPTTCFTTFGSRFPRMLVPKRLRGMLTAIDDFGQFAEFVRVWAWKGL